VAKDDKQSIAPTSEGTEYDDDGRIASAPIPPEMLERIRSAQAEQVELDKWRKHFDQIEHDKIAAMRVLAQMAPQSRRAPQTKPAKRMYDKLYPNGAPHTVMTKTIHGQIADGLKAEGHPPPYPSKKVVATIRKARERSR
jgi:hypothetical protein